MKVNSNNRNWMHSLHSCTMNWKGFCVVLHFRFGKIEASFKYFIIILIKDCQWATCCVCVSKISHSCGLLSVGLRAWQLWHILLPRLRKLWHQQDLVTSLTEAERFHRLKFNQLEILAYLPLKLLQFLLRFNPNRYVASAILKYI